MKNSRTRSAEISRHNTLAPPPAQHAPAPNRSVLEMIRRKVGKSGEVRIDLPRGVYVTVARASEEVYIVSSLPEERIRDIAAAVPRSKSSLYAALSEELGKRARTVAAPRKRHPYSGELTLPVITEDQAKANAGRRSQRTAR